MTSKTTTVTIGGKPGSFMQNAVASYITMLKGRLGLPVPDEHPSLRFQRKILVTYVEVCEFLRKGRPLSDAEREELQDCAARWERLLAKMVRHQKLYGEYRLWTAGQLEQEPEADNVSVFNDNDLWCIHEALAEYLVACRLMNKSADVTEDELAELGNDFRLYEMGYDAVSRAQWCLWQEFRNDLVRRR